MQLIIATLLLIGAVSAVPSISLGMYIDSCMLANSLIIFSTAPLNEKNENTIDEEYIVIFKKAAREIDGHCTCINYRRCIICVHCY